MGMMLTSIIYCIEVSDFMKNDCITDVYIFERIIIDIIK